MTSKKDGPIAKVYRKMIKEDVSKIPSDKIIEVYKYMQQIIGGN
jgi:uncharacterized FlaG/YvyC family protein